MTTRLCTEKLERVSSYILPSMTQSSIGVKIYVSVDIICRLNSILWYYFSALVGVEKLTVCLNVCEKKVCIATRLILLDEEEKRRENLS